MVKHLHKLCQDLSLAAQSVLPPGKHLIVFHFIIRLYFINEHTTYSRSLVVDTYEELSHRDILTDLFAIRFDHLLCANFLASCSTSRDCSPLYPVTLFRWIS